MERGELPVELAEEIRALFFSDGFMKIVQSLRRNGKTFKISIRPVEISGEKKYQAEMVDDGHVQVKNFDANGAAEGLEEIISQRGVRDLHLITATGDLHVRVTRKGRVTANRSVEMKRQVVLQPHDRIKKTPLTSFDSAALLSAIGLADADGRVKASMRGKYDQVNEFLKEISEALSNHTDKESFTVVDCGCGKAYLTIALCQYLKYSLGFKKVLVIGIDRREDVIDSARKTAERLDMAGEAVFAIGDLNEFKNLNDLKEIAELNVERPDMVISLHACDTATDEALAKGVEWKSRYIISAPCCQHELQKVIKANARDDFAGVLRYGILRERLCDILTDSFRAMILRILGFKTQVVEFVSQDATARNIMLKCEYGVKPGQGGTVSEYLNLRDSWKVTPWLETRMEKMIKKYLDRYE
ncbi:MAG: SAM-dependent methyltransferase [Kiritimatiellae bacterium]|nr:SAM-dependent methyltransferase [Kiritimatiellia bacterium]